MSVGLKFHGVDIETIAPVKIDDIKVSPITLNPVARERAIRAGADFVREHGGNRTVTVTFALLDSTASTRQASLLAISEWAKTDAEYKLQVPHFSDKYLMAVCTAKPEPSLRMWWEAKLRLVFTCYDNPYWTSSTEKTCACGTQFTAGGDAIPLMQIKNTFASAASNVAYSDGTHTMTFSTIPAGNMVIDLNNQTAKVGSSTIMGYYALTGKFVQPKTGTQTITGTGTVYYRERWT